MSQPAELAVVIPTFNGSDLLKECLAALKAQTFTNFRVYVVDNASTDDTAQLVARTWPGAALVEMPRNVGFCGAVNAGMRAGREPLILLLNNDAFPDAEMFEHLVERARGHPQESMWAAALVYAHDTQTVESAGVSVRADGTPCVLWRDQPVNSLPDHPTDVFGPCGAAAMFRRAVLDETGGFDERFGFYGDDTDFALRARLTGHACTLVPNARGRHKHRATSSRRPNLTAYLQHRNTVLYLIKCMPLSFLLRRLPRFLFTGARPLLTSPWRGEGWAILAAKFGVLWNLPYALRARRRIRQARKLADVDLLQSLRQPGPGAPQAVP